jgi:hypothetical protein
LAGFVHHHHDRYVLLLKNEHVSSFPYVVTERAYEISASAFWLILSKHILDPVNKAFVIMLVEVYSELRCEPHLFNPFTISKNMVNVFDFCIASRAERITMNPSSNKVASHR